LIVISIGILMSTIAIVYYIVKEVKLNWKYGHFQKRWPKEALEKSLKSNKRICKICTFMMFYLVVAPISVYLIERGSMGGSFLAAYLVVPALYPYFLRRVFRGQVKYCEKLLELSDS